MDWIVWQMMEGEKSEKLLLCLSTKFFGVLRFTLLLCSVVDSSMYVSMYHVCVWSKGHARLLKTTFSVHRTICSVFCTCYLSLLCSRIFDILFFILLFPFDIDLYDEIFMLHNNSIYHDTWITLYILTKKY